MAYLNRRVKIYSFQGFTILTMAVHPNAGRSTSGCITQCKFPIRFLTTCSKSTLTRTFVAKPWPGFLIRGIRNWRSTWLRAPSHPNRYFDRMPYTRFVKLSCTVLTIVPSDLRSNERKVVSKRHEQLENRLGNIDMAARTRGIVIALRKR